MNSCSDLYANGDKLKWCAIAWNGTVFAALAISGTGNRVMTTPEYAG